jgi:UDP:flavonoid glycosyltransferase YjiC (YdhE family)
MKVLVGCWPAYGHLMPMLPLVRAAQRAGHEVVVSSGADMKPVLDGLGVPAHRSGVTLAESYARLPDDTTISDLPPEEQAGFAARYLFGAGAVDRARDLAAFVDEWRPDLVVHDTLELGSPTIAAERGVPHVTHGYGPMVPGTDRFAAVVGTAIVAAGLPDPVPAVLAAPYVDICPPGLRGTVPCPWPTTVPLRPSAGEAAPDGSDVPDDLSDLPHPETVYVTLGTIMNQAAGVFRAVIDGCSELPVNLVVTTGPGLDPDLVGPLPPSVRTAPYLPQAALLPLCTAVVSHAGAGTMLGALCHGLPQLCLPQGTDQPFNTAALLPTGAALALQPDETTADTVAAAMTRLLGEESFRASAGRLRSEIEAMPTADDVLAGLFAAVP